MWKRKWLKLAEETGGEGSAGGVVTENATSFVAPQAEASPADDSTESNVNWDELADSSEDEVVEGDAQVVEPASAAPAVAPAATPATPEPAPAATPPAAVTPAPAATPPLEQPAAPAQASSAETYQAWRTSKVQELETRYAISEDDAAALLTEPEKVLPRLMAQAHLAVLESSMQATQAILPVMMQEIQQHNDLNNRAKNLFTSVNPDLADPQFEAAIMEFGKVYRNVNRTAPPEEAARAIGALVRSALGLAQTPAPTQHVQAPAPAAPVPFTPARGGGTMAQPGPSGNLFEQLANEFLQE